MKKRVLSYVGLFMFLFFCTLFIKAKDVSALGYYQVDFGETTSIKSEGNDASVDINGLNSKKIKVKVEITNVSVYNDDGSVVNDTIQVSYDEESEKQWYVKAGEVLTFTYYVDEYDDYTLEFELYSINNFSLDLKITKISEAELTISCHKPITMKDTELKKVRPIVYYGDEEVSEFADFKAKASKKNFVDIDTSDSDIEDYFYLFGIYNSGKCKITVTAKYKGQSCSDSFTLTIKSTLKKNLYVLGELYSYNTRSNIFTMYLTNRSKKQINIYSSEAVALDDDYVSFDRNVKMIKNKKSITIKPGKSKTIYWKVLGGTTWHDVDDFEIHFKCKYKGKVSWLSVQGENVYIWRKGKWKRMS